MTSNQLPTREEISRLPPWALTLFAVRCARRAYAACGAQLHARDRRQAIELVIDAASEVATLLADAKSPSYTTVAHLADAETIRSRECVEITAAVYAIQAAAKAAAQAVGVSDSATDAAYFAASAASHACAVEGDARLIRRDLAVVAALAREHPALPVKIPPGWFEPTTRPTGKVYPPGSAWEGVKSASIADDVKVITPEGTPSHSALEISLAFEDEATPEEIKAATAELAGLLDRVYRAHGGNGLVLDTLQVEAPALDEAPR